MKIDLFKILTFLKSHLKIIVLGLLILCLVYSALIFYYYAYTPLHFKETNWKRTSINEKLYKKVMERLKEREENKNNAIFKSCPDLFSSYSTSTNR